MTETKSRKKRKKDRLLDSAMRIFAVKGYRDATIAEICADADANVAAVNYYFGDKEALYVQAWNKAFVRSLEKYPPNGGVPADAPAEERLGGQVHSVVSRMTDPENYEFAILHKEHANPTGLLEQIFRESIHPIRQKMLELVRELIGPKAPDNVVELCQMSIISQCLHLMMRKRHQDMRQATGTPPAHQLPTQFSVETMTRHIVRFSLAGIREMRRQIDSGEITDMEEGPCE